MGYTDTRYLNFIKGKRVIFVGPSPCIMGESKGTFIDSFDIVIRTNGSFPVDKDNVIDYGERCDSLYVNCLFARVTNLPIDMYKSKGLKFLNLKQDTKKLATRYRPQYIMIRDLYQVWNASKREIGANPLMGSYIVWEILQHQPKSLYLTGMDCYANPDINSHYIDNYLPETCNVESLNDTRVKFHSQETQN